jgi:hypothetical protein
VIANDVTANDNGHGVYSPGRVAIDGLTATNKAVYGVGARRLRLRNSIVTGSGSGIDLWTRSRPSTLDRGHDDPSRGESRRGTPSAEVRRVPFGAHTARRTTPRVVPTINMNLDVTP